MPRALTQEEVKIKESFILDKAFSLFEKTSYKTFRMEDLAKKCKMSKGILFKYFKSKEILFLSMLQREQENSFNSLIKEARNHKSMSIQEFKDFVSNHFENTLDSTEPYMRLIKMKNVILEPKIDYDFAVKKKDVLNDLMHELAENILLKVDGLSLRKIIDLFAFVSILREGFLHTVIEDGVVKSVIENENLDMLKCNHKELAISSFQSYLSSM